MGRWCNRNSEITSFVKRLQSSNSCRHKAVMTTRSPPPVPSACTPQPAVPPLGRSPPPSPPSSGASSAGASPPTIIRTQPQPQSFCIDALLRPTGDCTSPLSPPPRGEGGLGSSPPSSPASSPFGPRPSLVSPLFPTNPATGGSLYPYPGALLTPGSAASPTSTGGNSSVTSSLESVLKNGMNMQTVQLEWLARTGMLYHRFPELAGNLSNVMPLLEKKLFMYIIY